MILVIALNLLLIVLWFTRKNRKENKPPWYVALIFPTETLSFLPITILTLLITISFVWRHYQSKEDQTIAEMAKIKEAISDYHTSTSRYPSSLDDIIGNNPLKRTWLKDAWGSNYKLTSTNNNFYLMSLGRDKQQGTKDDIQIEI